MVNEGGAAYSPEEIVIKHLALPRKASDWALRIIGIEQATQITVAAEYAGEARGSPSLPRSA